MTQRIRLFAMLVAALAASAIMMLWIRRYSVSVRDLHALAAQLRWWPLPAILALLAALVALAAARWSSIEEALGGSRPHFGTAFAAGAIALGVGTVLPGPLTNIAARAMSNRFGGHGTIRGAVSGAVDQLADLAIVVLFVPASIIGVATESLPLYLCGIAISAGLGFGGLLLAPSLARSLLRLPFASRVRSPAEKLMCGTVLRTIYCLSLLRFGCLTAITLLVHFATGAATSSAAVIAIPLVTVAISVAMLPGGFGISEWSFSAVFAAMGMEHEQIVIFVLGNRLLLSAGALVLMMMALGRAAVRGVEGYVIRRSAKVEI